MGTRRNYVIFGLVALNLLMASIDSTIVAVGLPTILVDLNTSLNWLGWVITGYMLVNTIAMPLVGRIGDDFGRKRLFLIATTLFTTSSFLCGFAPNVYFLIFFRILQAVGGGSFMPSGVAIVSDHFKHERAKMIGLFTAIMPIGGIIGPNLGGWLIEQYSWRSIFYVNVPIGIVVAIAGYLLLKDDQPVEHKPNTIDFKGAALISGTVASFMFALTQMGESDARFADPFAWLAAVAGVVFLTLFIRTETRVADPILDLSLLRWRPFAAMNALNFLIGACAMGVFSLIPTYAVMAYNMTTLESGALMTPRSIGTILMAVLASFLLNRFGYHLPLIVGFLVTAFSIFLLGQGFHNISMFGFAISDFTLLAILVAINGLGMGLTFPSANNAAIDLIPGRVGAITGLRGMFRQMGGVMGASASLLVMSLHDNPADGLRTVYVAIAIIIVVMTPLIMAIPRRSQLLTRLQTAEQT